MNLKQTILITNLFIALSFYAQEDIEEVVSTGSLIKDVESDSSPVEVISNEDYKKLNITNIAEISKYINSSSGSHFQANTLGGIDQGMAAVTLRGLDHASTLLLINSRRQTFAGTPSHEGEGYIDANIIPEVAIEKIEILKEGATSLYGSDAVAGVVNFFTRKSFDGFIVQFGDQTTANYSQKDQNLGLLYGDKYGDFNLVVSFNLLDRTPLSASEIPRLAELAVSSLGNTFIVTEADEIEEGLYKGSYTSGQIVADPNCAENGGILDGFCKFQYGTRFNITNTEDHAKYYLSLNNDIHDLTLISSNVRVIDNPQSPSYPALPYLSRLIMPGEGSSPFNVPVRWYGRPLGSWYPSPNSPKDISQFHLSYSFNTNFDGYEFEYALTHSQHRNNHYRPDIIDSRFQSAMAGNGGINGDEQWNIFEPLTNSQNLIDYVTGAEVSEKVGALTTFDAIGRSSFNDLDFAFGLQLNKENLEIKYNDISTAEFDIDGKIIKTADLFFLGGGKNVSTDRNKFALFIEGEKEFNDVLDLRIAGRYEDSNNFSSFDPKLSIKLHPSEELAFRLSRGSSFSMPSMAQMFSSEINLGSVRDFENSIFVRQAQIGNPNLKPATSVNSNYGFIFNQLSRKITFDYWSISYKNRIEGESAQALLAEDPYGKSITRNELGDLIGVTSTYFNEEYSKVSGLDFEYSEMFYLGDYGDLEFSIRGTNFYEFLTPDHEEEHEEEHSDLINRVGKFNYDSHTHSLPQKRINAFVDWSYLDNRLGLVARYVDGYENDREIPTSVQSLGYSNKIDSFLVFDLSFEKTLMNISDDYSLQGTFSLINILDEKPPLLYDAPDFSFDTRVHDPRGRLINIQFEIRPN